MFRHAVKLTIPWLQIAVVLVGTAWCLALTCTAFFVGWYAHMHPARGDDRVMHWLAHLLWFLTFGLTDDPFPDLEDEPADQRITEE
ncbi:MAG TPA: hypothetical protein VGN34_11670 [Ktedonobacteraceae bacterium]|jgi:hypothetical protein